MAVRTRTVTVGTSATRLDATAETDFRTGSIGYIHNTGGATIYFGGPDVNTTDKGDPLLNGDRLYFDAADSDALYGIVGSGTNAVKVVEFGV